MKTKNEVIESMRSEIEMGNSVVFESLGNGGSGLTITNDKNEIDNLIEELESYNFNGLSNESGVEEEYEFVENVYSYNPHTYIIKVCK